MNIINNLLDYSIKFHLILERDRVYCFNQILSLLKITDVTKLSDYPSAHNKDDIDQLLAPLIQFAVNTKIIESSHPDFADLFDTAIMGALCPMPSTVQQKFEQFTNPKQATDYLYNLSINSNYVRMNRIKKNIQWQSSSPIGKLQITINLSKPEKDPKMIALQKNTPTNSYPKCVLCKENEGFAGSLSQAARQNIRTAEFTMSGEYWYLQYSPYIYYPEHSIIFSSEHRPMVISKKTFTNLLTFIDSFPHYFIGSNSDIPIVGGSILSHDHYQSGCHQFPINHAKVIKNWQYKDIEVQIVDWALSLVRLKSKDKNQIIELADKILHYWIAYENADLNIIKESNSDRHNAITPIARRNGDYFELDLVLRNNRTTDEYPWGIFHPHEDKHHIKKENIGLIEVMGLAILPARLQEEMELVKSCLLKNDLSNVEESCQKHVPWIKKLLDKHTINTTNVEQILQDEIGLTFYEVLNDCKVFQKDTDLQLFTTKMLDDFK